jgi:LmbE family N-acetylglucosaminyl deacetylase
VFNPKPKLPKNASPMAFAGIVKTLEQLIKSGENHSILEALSLLQLIREEVEKEVMFVHYIPHSQRPENHKNLVIQK